MWIGHIALIAAAAFTGAALYVSIAEHPARLRLDLRAMLMQWQASYPRATIMQASLVIIGSVCGVIAFFVFKYDWRWLLGAALMFAPWPYTMLIIMPTNRQLKTTLPELANEQTHSLIQQWGRLHLVRTGLGALATIEYFWALN
jgi:Domain of unknown function (DUF1772)